MTKLYVENDSLYQDPECDGPVIAHVLDGEYDMDGKNMTARRMAACWNMCDGVSTEQLEVDLAQRHDPWAHAERLQADIDKLADDYRARGLALQAAKAMQAGETERADKAEAQRDQLAKLLESAMTADVLDLFPAEYVNRVNAALAAVKGE